MTYEDMLDRHSAYGAALWAMFRDNPSKITQGRYVVFKRWTWQQREAYLEWVEANAETIPLCSALVAAAVTAKINPPEKP